MPLSSAIQFILLNLTALTSSVLLAAIIFRNKEISLVKLILSTSIIFLSQIILVEEALGSLQLLTYTNISIFIYFIFFIILIISLKYSSTKINISKPSFPSLLTILIFLPLFTVITLKSIAGLLTPPLEYDAVAYHLPFVAEWLTTKSLLGQYYSAFAGPISYYPSNHELLDFWLISPFKNDTLINIINVPLLLLLGISLYGICRNFNIPKNFSAIVTASVLYAPVFFKQASVPLVDAFFTLGFLLALFYIQELHKNRLLKDAVFFGLSFGLFLGTKYIALPYGIMLFIIFLITAKKSKLILAGTLSTILTGSFFYIRNIISSGNPLFPLNIKFFNTTILEGYKNFPEKFSGSSIWDNLGNQETFFSLAKAFYSEAGPQISIVLLTAIIGLTYLIFKAFKNKKPQGNIKIQWLFVILVFVYFILYLKMPYSFTHIDQNVRYAMIPIALANITAGLLLSKTKIFKTIFCVLIVFSLATIITQFKTFRPPDITTLFSADYSYKTAYANDYKILNLMDGISWLNKNDPTAEVAYTGFNFHYHLFGEDLSRKVDYVNINNCSDCRYFEFKDSKNSIRTSPDYSNWLNNLKLKNKKYIIIESRPETEMEIYELDWALSHPENFEQVFNKGSVYIFKILKNA